MTTAEAWNSRRRPEIMGLFETYMFGKVPVPPHPIKPTFSVQSEDKNALGGKAIRREVAIRFNEDPAGPVINLLVYLPRNAGAGQRVPAFLGLNFEGNHAVSTDPGIALSTQWLRDNPKAGVVNHRATEASRGPRPRGGRSSGSSIAATPWRPRTTATSTRITMTASRTGSSPSSTSQARPGPHRTNGARLPPGPGA